MQMTVFPTPPPGTEAERWLTWRTSRAKACGTERWPHWWDVESWHTVPNSPRLRGRRRRVYYITRCEYCGARRGQLQRAWQGPG